MDQYDPEQLSPPEAFVKQVKEALEHLYDFFYLKRHPLAREGELASERPYHCSGARAVV
jgi:hypothetical protein